MTLTIGALAAGVSPQSVLPSIAAAVAERTVVEASDLAVVSASARVTVRYEAEDETARAVAEHAVARTRAVAEVVSWRVTRRVGGRWHPVY